MTTESATAVPAARDRWLLGAGGVAVTLFILIVVGRPWDLHDALMIGTPIGRDFPNFWIGGVLAIEGKLDLLVDFDGYNELIFQTFHYNPRGFVFSYPPNILPFLVPFGALWYPLSVVLWSAGNLWLTARAVRLLSAEAGLPWIAVLSPATLIIAGGRPRLADDSMREHALANRRPIASNAAWTAQITSTASTIRRCRRDRSASA
jgi:hypothetical protein